MLLLWLRDEYVPRSEVRMLPDNAENIFCEAVISSSPVPAAPLPARAAVDMFKELSRPTNVSWLWPSAAASNAVVMMAPGACWF